MLRGPIPLESAPILTPALVLDAAALEANLAAMLRLLDGEPDRWRPHVKTAKLSFTMRRLVARGVRRFKCATSLELRVAAEAGAAEVLVAYPAVGAFQRRIREFAEQHREIGVCALVDSPQALGGWRDSRVGLFIDLDPGMRRTGVPVEETEAIVELARCVLREGLALAGVHYYEGHLGHLPFAPREREAHRGYERLLAAVAELESRGIPVGEVVTSGTPTVPCALSHRGLRGLGRRHRVSPGTLVYNDVTSLGQLPAELGFRPAVYVLSTVVSRPAAGWITCDAGHKTISADAGIPTCAVLDDPALEPARPSEEHLPIRVPPDRPCPELGARLCLLPRHICPTVNQFDHALIVQEGCIVAVESVDARGREAPLGASRAAPKRRSEG